MITVDVTIDGVILHSDPSIAGINIGNGYTIKKCYLSELPYKNKLTDGDGKLSFNYLGSQLSDENGTYFMCLHKDDRYEIQGVQIRPGIILNYDDLMCEQQLYEYKHKEMQYLHKIFSLLHLFKKGNIGFVQLFFEHNFTVLGFINQKMKQLDNSITKNVVENTVYSLSDNEIIECNNFLSSVSDNEFELIKENIDEFIWGLELPDIPTGFEQYTTALEMTLLAKGEQCKKEVLSKRVAVLLESNPSKVQQLYTKMKNFYRYRSESLHEGNGQDITLTELKDLEEIVRRVLKKYLKFCKTAITVDPTITWDIIKRDKISDLKNTVSTFISASILPI